MNAPPLRWRAGGWAPGAGSAPPDESAVAIVIDGASQAVLMATPQDLGDFGLGFALTEGLIDAPSEVEAIEIVEIEVAGIPAHEVRLWLPPGRAVQAAERRRSMVGPVGCGLCGIDSIEAALPAIRRVAPGGTMTPAQVMQAMQALGDNQILRRRTPAIHGAGFWDGDITVREDVGRHNALDKLAGALAGRDASRGAVVISSRLSVDLVQKTTRIGAGLLIGAGAATDLAIRWADLAGITLIARAFAGPDGGFEIHTHPERIQG